MVKTGPSVRRISIACSTVSLPTLYSSWSGLYRSLLWSEVVVRLMLREQDHCQANFDMAEMPAWRPAHRVNQFCPHLARMGPSAGVASTGDTPEWDVSGTEAGRRRRGRTSWPVRRVLVATLRSAWREDLCLWACRRPGLLHIRHQAWVAPVAVLPLPVSCTSMRATGQVRQHVRWYRIDLLLRRTLHDFLQRGHVARMWHATRPWDIRTTACDPRLDLVSAPSCARNPAAVGSHCLVSEDGP